MATESTLSTENIIEENLEKYETNPIAGAGLPAKLFIINVLFASKRAPTGEISIFRAYLME
jgi:hypothetical protein